MFCVDDAYASRNLIDDDDDSILVLIFSSVIFENRRLGMVSLLSR